MRATAHRPENRCPPHVPFLLARASGGGGDVTRKEVSAGTRSGATHNNKKTAATADTGKPTTQRRPSTSSQQVAWWSVHVFVAERLERVGDWPMAGTPAWCALADDDPAKSAALLDAAQHWALRVETCQEAHCDASRQVSDAVDWSALAREINERTDFYGARPWLKRVAS
jgi:hypothetical protein